MLVDTVFGSINFSEGCEFYKNGSISCGIVSKRIHIDTPIGDVVPNFSFEDGRKKHRPSLEFFENGEIKSIYLEVPIYADTAIGKIKAELVTFYKNGGIKRIFPVYGQISGFRSEEDEYLLAEKTEFKIFDNIINAVPQCVHFYEGGALRSITLWKFSPLVLPTRYGDIKTTVGIEFYESGEIKSIEPYIGTKLVIDGKKRNVFDINALGMHADNNSLVFDKEGNVISWFR